MKLEEELLISAYLDGEVSVDEGQRAEKLLAGSAEARQLADEMRAVRVRLQGLPRFGLPADFAEQTVRRAEQELAAAKTVETAIASVAPAGSDESRSAQPAGPSIWTTWRGFAWAAVALAAALLIVVTNRPSVEYSTQIAEAQGKNAAPTSSVAARESEQSSNQPAPSVSVPPMKHVAGEPAVGSAMRGQSGSETPSHSEPATTGFSAKSDRPPHYSGLPEGATGKKASDAAMV